MKKSIFLVLLLLCLSVGTFYVAHTQINGQKDAQTIKETILLGDKTNIDGITIKSLTHSNYHLLWDTQFPLNNPLDLKRNFTFAQEKEIFAVPYTPQMSLYSSNNFDISGENINLEEKNTDFSLKPALDIATRTPNGETRTEIVSLSNYYEFYPIAMDLQVPFSDEANFFNNMHHILTNYFHIPVSKQQKIEVSITKDENGQITNISSNNASDGVYVSSESIIVSSGYYFILKASNEFDNSPYLLQSDTSGIHFLPFVKRQDYVETDAARMSCVYPLESESIQALSIIKGLEDNTLLLVTKESNTIMLSVIDLDTMTLIQKTAISKETSDSKFDMIKSFDGFIVCSFSDNTFYLLTPNAEKHYTIQMHEIFPRLDDISYIPFYEMVMAYDGNRLVTAFYNSMYSSCRIYTLVYDSNGVAYAARYDASTDNSVETNYSKIVRPYDYNALTISFDH